ncbi:MAG: hypothetical protein IPM24_19475 [Bryobacterales bacterium]|nr:hypothetical protein [Bryobacterales bacterium]
MAAAVKRGMNQACWSTKISRCIWQKALPGMLKGGRARVEMVWLAADRDDFNEEWTGKLSSEVDYAYWYSLYRRTRGQLKPMAQLTKAEMGTVLRVRDSRGVHRQVLEGSDPLDFGLMIKKEDT